MSAKSTVSIKCITLYLHSVRQMQWLLSLSRILDQAFYSIMANIVYKIRKVCACEVHFYVKAPPWVPAFTNGLSLTQNLWNNISLKPC